jgi:hypothetical protein
VLALELAHDGVDRDRYPWQGGADVRVDEFRRLLAIASLERPDQDIGHGKTSLSVARAVPVVMKAATGAVRPDRTYAVRA